MEIEDEIIGECYESLKIEIKGMALKKIKVLIIGPTGTGKDRLARLYAKTINRPIKPINCAAFSNDMLASELFGHEKGAFTGAVNEHIGIFETANKAEEVVFLDEIGDASDQLQAMLLGVLETREIKMVGSAKVKKLEKEVICIAATNKISITNSEEKMDAQGPLRSDLRARFRQIVIPEFSDGDIAEFTQYFLKQNGLERISEKALAILFFYPWPENVREIKYTIEGIAANKIANNTIERLVSFDEVPFKIFKNSGLQREIERRVFNDKKIIKNKEIVEWCEEHPKGRLLGSGVVKKESLTKSETVVLTDAMQVQVETVQKSEKMKDIKLEHAVKMYQKYGENIELTAKKIGVTPKTLSSHLKKAGSSKKDEPQVDSLKLMGTL